MNVRWAYLLLGNIALMVHCSPYMHQPLRMTEARLGAETPQFQELKALPKPKEKIVAAVYKFRDQTGQYKAVENGASWSTAVTQGATSILLRTMEESGWFIPIEREGLSNLLNERKIIRSSKASYTEPQNNDPILPPLIFAGIILEGGIISFDSNIMTGGAGARYFGTGGSSKYRQDRVTIYLRAVSTGNGRIIKTVYTSKTILSQQVDVGIFRFVSFKRLLEAETGFTYNEPGEMAVKEAIEKAVYALIVEGINEKLWSIGTGDSARTEAVKRYLVEKESNGHVDAFGNDLRERRGVLGIGLKGSALYYDGDYSESQVYGGGEIDLEYRAMSRLSYVLSAGMGDIGTSMGYRGRVAYGELGLKYKFFEKLKTTPYLQGGFGLLGEVKNSLDNTVRLSNAYYPCASVGMGAEILVAPRVGLQGAVHRRMAFTDNLDRLEQGRFDDTFWGAQVGLVFYAW